ncbi:redoxin domain-containing protein [Croceitalea marina]|uniref:Redoxin domain-containing protein n=1 Tax=Croceitalea marina TaxID=1775166 RepID=A0ABW5MQ81_9FLAO
MKKFLAVATIAISIIACGTGTDGYTINGEITGGMNDSTKVYLKTMDSTKKLVDIDTALIIAGKFKFEGTQDAPALHYMVFEGIRGNWPLMLENGTISYKGQKDSLIFTNAEGTPQNEFFANFLKEQRKLRQMAESINGEMRIANQTRDTATLSSLREEYFELQERSQNFNKEFIKNNPSAIISVLLLDNLLKTKAIPSKEVRALFDGFTEDLKKSKPGKELSEQLNAMAATEVGASAPKFSGPTPDGKILALNDVKGKLTLVDFWAAWCRPCRAENPNIVSVYHKYKDKGFNVVGVSLDRKSEDWLKAIEADSLAWNHVSNLQYFNDPIAKMYNINAIPAAFLLDENGVIVAKDLRGPALEEKVAELLLN